MMKRPKLSWKEKLLFVTPFLVVALSSLLPYQDGVSKAMRQLSGPNAVDYGVKNVMSEKRVFAAAQAGKPFRALIGIDKASNGLIGMVRTPQGELYDLYWQRGSWVSKGRIVTIARVRNLKLYPNGVLEHDGGNGLTPEEQAKLLAE